MTACCAFTDIGGRPAVGFRTSAEPLPGLYGTIDDVGREIRGLHGFSDAILKPRGRPLRPLVARFRRLDLPKLATTGSLKGEPKGGGCHANDKSI